MPTSRRTVLKRLGAAASSRPGLRSSARRRPRRPPRPGTRSSSTRSPAPTTRGSPPRSTWPAAAPRAARSASLRATTPSARPGRPSRDCASSARTSGGRTRRSRTPTAPSRSATSRSTAAPARSSWLVGHRDDLQRRRSRASRFKSSNGNDAVLPPPLQRGDVLRHASATTLSFYGFKHVVGTARRRLRDDAQHRSRATWTCVGVKGTQFSLRGSDNFLWVERRR